MISLDSLKKKIEAIFRKEVPPEPVTKYSKVSITISKGVSLLLLWQVKLQALQTSFSNMTWALSHLTKDLSFAVIFSLFFVLSTFPYLLDRHQTRSL